MSNNSPSGCSLFGAAGLGLLVIALISLILLPMHGCSAVLGLGHSAIDTAAAQFDPKVMLKRYEWFKDAAAQLDKKKADIAVYEKRFAQLKADYAGKSRSEWPREDREQANLWSSEVAGITASYNDLAAQYNGAMAKANHAFTNVGDLPRGASTPLPREFKTYEGSF